MEIHFTAPTKEDIFSKGIIVSIARQNEKWVSSQLHDYAKKSGLYIQHCNREILYVGITIKGGSWGNYAERLRREFQYSSSSNSHLHQLLSCQTEPVKVSFYDLEEIEKMFESSIQLKPENKVLIAEQILISIFNPQGNRKDKVN